MESFGHQGRLEDERMLKGAGRYATGQVAKSLNAQGGL
jgi:hypothetical protein